MRSTTAGLLIGAGLATAVALAFSLRPSGPAQALGAGSTSHVASSENVVVLTLPREGGSEQLVVVDPNQRVMAVYQVDGARGELALTSVRNFRWDLQMDEFNGTSPSPREIRAMLDRR
jgi:hypothetical protein